LARALLRLQQKREEAMNWVKAITFDFWGTLVDVDTSGALGMAKVLAKVGLQDLDPRELYFRWDAATVRRYRSDSWRPYVEWSALGLKDVLEPLGVAQPEPGWLALAELLVSTMTSEAKPHPEVPNVIAALKKRLPLMPITNMDTRLFELNPFRRAFDLALTAEEVGAFKPSAFIFSAAIERLGVEPSSILHVSLAQFADLEGAMPLGMKVAWINRGREELGPFTPKPMFEFPDLSGLGALFE
jgi:2-haloacid dehalogenase